MVYCLCNLVYGVTQIIKLRCSGLAWRDAIRKYRNPTRYSINENEEDQGVGGRGTTFNANITVGKMNVQDERRSMTSSHTTSEKRPISGIEYRRSGETMENIPLLERTSAITTLHHDPLSSASTQSPPLPSRVITTSPTTPVTSYLITQTTPVSSSSTNLP